VHSESILVVHHGVFMVVGHPALVVISSHVVNASTFL